MIDLNNIPAKKLNEFCKKNNLMVVTEKRTMIKNLKNDIHKK